MQVALADGQGKIVGILQPQKITFWSWNETQIWRWQNGKYDKRTYLTMVGVKRCLYASKDNENTHDEKLQMRCNKDPIAIVLPTPPILLVFVVAFWNHV